MAARGAVDVPLVSWDLVIRTGSLTVLGYGLVGALVLLIAWRVGKR